VGCFLQGLLAHAKDGDELYCEEKFHAINGKAQTCIQGVLFFFLLSLVEGEGGGGCVKGFQLKHDKGICTLLFKKCH
jgi:hypothetical protein